MGRPTDPLTTVAQPAAKPRPESILVAYALIRTALARRDAHMEQLLADTRNDAALTTADSGRMAA